MKITKLSCEKWLADQDVFDSFTKKLMFTREKVQFNRWSWMVDGVEYHTNDEGEGMWRNDSQVIGTCDFSLKRMSISGARKKLNRHFRDSDDF